MSMKNSEFLSVALAGAIAFTMRAATDDETHWDGHLVRTWTATEPGAMTNAANWNVADDFAATDYLLVNNGGTATIAAGESVSADYLYVGRGWKFDDGAWKNSTDYDTGAVVNMTGGELVVSNDLYLGAGYSDYYDSIFSASGDSSVFAYNLMVGDFASKGGRQDHAKVSRLLLGGNADVLAHKLHIGNWWESSNEVVIAENATLTVTNAFELGSSGHTVYTQNGGTVSVRTGKTSWGGDMDVKFGNGGTLSATIGGGTFNFSNALAFGDGGSTTLALTGGTVQAVEEDAGKRQVYVGLGSSGTAEVTLSQGGTLSVGSIHVGRDGGTGTLVLNGGNLALNAPSWWGALNLGWGDNSRGTVRVERGTYAYSGYTCVGRDNGSVGIFEMRGGEFNVDGWMGVGHNANSTGIVVVAGGNLNVSNLSIGHENSAAVGKVTVNGGELRSYNDIYLGNNGCGSLTINDGRVVCANVNAETGAPADRWLKFNNAANSDFAGTSVLNLNGGTLAVSHIANDGNASAKSVINFNGGRLQTYPKSWNTDMIQSGDNLTVNILDGGAKLDTNGYDGLMLPAALNGDGGDCAGGIVKEGEGMLTISGSIGIKGYIKVEAGTLQINSSVAELDKIEVAEGATLLLNGATVRSVRTLVKNGTIKNEASDADEVVITATNKKLASAVWTGAVDTDLENPLNWKVFDEDGKRVSADELPTSDCVVQVHYSTNMPDFSGLNVKSIAMVVSGTVAPRGNWTVPAVVKDAIAWYDPSVRSSMNVDGNGKVSGLANLGTAGQTLDLAAYDAQSIPAIGETYKLNGRQTLGFVHKRGFVSKEGYKFSDGGKSLFAIMGRSSDMLPEGGSNPQVFGIEIHSLNSDYGGHFEVAQWPWWGGRLEVGCIGEESGFINLNDIVNDDRSIYMWGLLAGETTATGFAAYTDPLTDAMKTFASAGKTYGGLSATTSEDGLRHVVVGMRYRDKAESDGFVGETMAFDRVLDATEVAAVTNYLYQKWYTVPEVDMANLPTSIVFEDENAVYNLGGGDWTFANVAGGGAISNANITVTGTLTVVVNDDGTIDPLEIDGKLTLGENARLFVKGAHRLTSKSVDAIVAAGGIVGTFASVESDSMSVKAKYANGVVQVSKRGGMCIFIQ